MVTWPWTKNNCLIYRLGLLDCKPKRHVMLSQWTHTLSMQLVDKLIRYLYTAVRCCVWVWNYPWTCCRWCLFDGRWWLSSVCLSVTVQASPAVQCHTMSQRWRTWRTKGDWLTAASLLLLSQMSVSLSALWHCWLGGRKSIRPIKCWVMRCWHGCLSGARWKWFAYGPADVTVTPSSLASLKSRLVDWLLAYPGCPGKEAIKHVPICQEIVVS